MTAKKKASEAKDDVKRNIPTPADLTDPGMIDTIDTENTAPTPPVNESMAPLTANEIPNVKVSDPEQLVLAGFLQSWCEQELNVSLNQVPRDYKIINIEYGVLDNNAVVHFSPCSTNLNVPEIQEVRKKNRVKVMLTVGGEDGNFEFLNSSGNVTNFYNSLWTLYQSWGFDGVTFDIQQLNSRNRPFVIEGIRHFKEVCPEAIISIAAQPTYVCPLDNKIEGIYNQLVPVICYQKTDTDGNVTFKMIDNINNIQIMAFNYGDAYQKFANEKASPPIVIPTDPVEMLEFIFNSYTQSFTVVSDVESLDGENETIVYPGFPAEKLMLGVLSFPSSDYSDYVPADKVKEALDALPTKAGASIFNINYDSLTNYSFTNTLLGRPTTNNNE